MIHSFLQDLRYGVRLLARSPGFAIAAILMLGLGVGSSTAIFGIVESVLLRPLPYPDSHRIVTLSEVDDRGVRRPVSLDTFREWTVQAKSFDAIAAMSGDSTTIVTRQQSRRVFALRFHGDVIRVFGTAIGHGRAITADEIRIGAPVAIVPNAFAKDVFEDPPRAVGEPLELGGVSLTIVGVLAPAFDERIDVYAPAAAVARDPATGPDTNWGVMARLRADTALATARSEMQTIARRLRAERGTATASRAGADEDAPAGTGAGAAAAGRDVAVSSLLDDTVRGIRPSLLALLAAGGLLMLIACANVANLLLARGVSRRREIAVRQVLGAGRARVIRQLIVESLPLALLSAGAGIVIAHWSFSGLLAMVPFSIPRRGEITIDTTTLLFGLLVSLVAGLVFTLAPALHTPTRQLTSRLQSSGRTASGRDGALRNTLVVSQFAVALAVLTCAGLLTKSVIRLTQVDTGFDYARALVAETELPMSQYGSDTQLRTFWQRAVERMAALPGVEAVGVVGSAPLDGNYPNGMFELLDESGRQGRAWYGVATAGFFTALDVPLLQGRLFDGRDVPTAPHAAVINQLAAERFWPGQNPIGRRVRWTGEGADATAGAREALTIVGVIGNLRHNSLRVEPVPEIYAYFFQRPSRARDADLVIRSATPGTLTDAARREFEALDRDLPVRFHTLESAYRDSLAQPRFQAMLIGFFAVCALALSAAGLYSSMAYAVSRQTREIGIRLALGGTPGAVRRQMLMTALRIAAIGAVLGGLLGAIGGRLIANQLFDVSAGDAGVFITAGLVLATTALLAAYLPARRASRTDPIAALRYE